MGKIARCIYRRREDARDGSEKYDTEASWLSQYYAPCTQTNRDTNIKSCNKHYLQHFRTTTTLNELSGRAEYCRTKHGDNPTVLKQGGNSWVDVPVGNQWVVPYNPYLLFLLDCHI